jgi:hypothetical protein
VRSRGGGGASGGRVELHFGINVLQVPVKRLALEGLAQRQPLTHVAHIHVGRARV